MNELFCLVRSELSAGVGESDALKIVLSLCIDQEKAPVALSFLRNFFLETSEFSPTQPQIAEIASKLGAAYHEFSREFSRSEFVDSSELKELIEKVDSAWYALIVLASKTSGESGVQTAVEQFGEAEHGLYKTY